MTWSSVVLFKNRVMNYGGSHSKKVRRAVARLQTYLTERAPDVTSKSLRTTLRRALCRCAAESGIARALDSYLAGRGT